MTLTYSIVTINDLPEYRVQSFGNGLAYNVTRKSDGAAILLQTQIAVSPLAGPAACSAILR